MRGFYQSLSGHTLGVGVGLRARHVDHILAHQPQIDWFELLADNHLAAGGWARRQAVVIAERYPVTMHCVGMSIAGTDALNFDYLDNIKQLAKEVKPKLISDHLCWTAWQAQQSHDLLPFPFTEESLDHVVDRISAIQDHLACRIAVENISSYLGYSNSNIEEAEFINEVARQTDCGILLDLNNLYVNHFNNQQDIAAYIKTIDLARVVEIHLAGFEDKGHYYLDAHNNKVHPQVWSLFETLTQMRNDIPALIEWDHDIPEFSVLLSEAQQAVSIKQSHLKEGADVYVA